MIVFLMSLVVQTWSFRSLPTHARSVPTHAPTSQRFGAPDDRQAEPSRMRSDLRDPSWWHGAGWKTVVFETQHGT